MMIRELMLILAAATIIVVGERKYHVNPGWLVLAAVGLWALGRGLEVAYVVWSKMRKQKADYEAWKARRAEALKKLEEDAARRADTSPRVRRH